MKIVTLKKGKEKSLLRRHRWVFSGAIARTSEELDSGELVSVETSKAEFLGIGHYHNGSIAVRMLTFEKERIDQSFWDKRLQSAFDVRKSIGLPKSQTNCFRLIHAEGDGLPGCVVDIYTDCAVIQTHTDGMANEVKQITSALENLKRLKLKTIYHRNLAQKQNSFVKGNEAKGV